MIDVLVPVLNRPQNAAPLVESFNATAGPMDELHFLCTPGDDAEIEACLQTGANVLIVDFQAGWGDYARKMNYGYEHTERPFLFLGADDLTFSPRWWEAALEVMEGNSVVATNDQANAAVRRGQFGTHCLVRRTYITVYGASADGPGHFIHTGYDHNFVDRELCHLAESRGEYGFARNAIVKHRHHLWRTAPLDATYEKGIANFTKDQILFYRRAHLWDYIGMKPYERRLANRRTRYSRAR